MVAENKVNQLDDALCKIREREAAKDDKIKKQEALIESLQSAEKP